MVCVRIQPPDAGRGALRERQTLGLITRIIPGGCDELGFAVGIREELWSSDLRGGAFPAHPSTSVLGNVPPTICRPQYLGDLAATSPCEDDGVGKRGRHLKTAAATFPFPAPPPRVSPDAARAQTSKWGHHRFLPPQQ